LQHASSTNDKAREGDSLLAELAYMQWLMESGYRDLRPLPDGKRWAGIMPFLYTTAIIVGCIHDYTGYEDRWCYRPYADALRALEAWDEAPGTEPSGWVCHPSSGRRRPSGDPAREYINP
jgi:hypothetical protein